MPNRPDLARALATILVVAGCLASLPACAEGPGPVYKDLERFDGPMIPTASGDRAGLDRTRRPARVVQGDSGYVGSAYGLGKPSFTGLGSRPDPISPD